MLSARLLASDNRDAVRSAAASATTMDPVPASTAFRARPPTSPNAHGRSRSELPPSSPRMVAPPERNAATATLDSSGHRDGPTASLSSSRSGLHRDASATSPTEANGSGGSASSSYLSRSRTQPAAATSGSQQPLGSTAFRNRFLNSTSTSSLSSANNSPELGSFSHLSTATSMASSNPTPPTAGAPTGPTPTAPGGGFKLAPLGGATGLSRKPSISMLSAVAEDRPAPAPAPRLEGVLDTRYDVRRDRSAKPMASIDSSRASLDEHRDSPPHESDGMVPYAHRRTASRTIGPGDASTTSESMSTVSGTQGGTTLVNTTTGVSLKRSTSETVTQGMMGPPVVRPASSMSLYRDEPVQEVIARPAVARVPSGRQVLAERPSAVDLHVPEPAQEVYHPNHAEQLQHQQPSFQPYHDENAYDPRAGHARPDGPLPSASAPSSSLPQQQAHRPVLAEVNRGYTQPQAPSTQQRTAAPLYGMQTAQKAGGEYQMPLRDRSPGLAEATPSATVQQGHYQSQQAYQQRQQQMQHAPPYQHQLQPQQTQAQMQAPGVSFAAAPEQLTVERKMSKPIIVSVRCLIPATNRALANTCVTHRSTVACTTG